MAEVISNGAVMSRTDASGNPKPIGKQPHSSDFNPNSRATIGWSWRKGLAYPLPRYSPIIAREIVIRLSCHSGSSGCGFWRNLSLALLLTTCQPRGASQAQWNSPRCDAAWIN